LINYAACIFLSAFLLFQIQPILSKTLLPWFGGTPAVWSSAMLFFQVALTGGYAYSNWLVRNRTNKKQTAIHLILMGISVCLVIYLWIIWPSPVTPAGSWKPESVANPVLYIFFLLTISVGLPFFVLSTNSPLMQSWFSRKNPGRSPYWLYALSNFGSLLGLLAYPTLVEPALTLQRQGWIWAGGYILFVLIAGYNAILTTRVVHSPVPVEVDPSPMDGQKSRVRTQALWILLSASASILVLAVTSQITQEVAPIPFLWVLPLSIYLLSFVFAFSSRRWYERKVFTLLLMLATAAWVYVILNPYTNFILQIVIYNFLLFTAAMVCHGELYALRPDSTLLTRFYLMASIGGALGALIVNLVAPYIFPGYWELYIGFALVWVLLAVLSYQHKSTPTGMRFGLLTGAMATAVSIFMVFLMFISTSGDLFVQRNFYGVVHVKQIKIEKGQKQANTMYHGSTIHGLQHVDEALRYIPTSYFSTTSGIGLAIVNHPRYGAGMRVGVLGLGVGTLAAYGQAGDTYRFYEINPVVIDLANGQGDYFSFLADSPASIDVVAGDARISLEKELDNQFDILVLDVFSSDSVPVHLLTREAFDIYLQNMAVDGLFAANISNVRLDLRPVFWQLAQYYDLQMAVIQNPAGENNPDGFTSSWVLLTRNPKLLAAPALTERMAPMDDFRTDIRLWTDDYSNLFQIVK